MCTHPGTSCEKTAEHRGDDQLVMDLAQQLHWKRCSNCQRFVELSHGCVHMRCRCGHEFCYSCGVVWEMPRKCTCALWEEHNLLAEGHRRAAVIVHQQETTAHREDIVNHEIEHLRAQQGDCGRACDWGKVTQYGGACERCNFNMNRYHYICGTHRTRICLKCRYHRM